MCKKVVIIGTGGHGKVVADIVRKSNDIVKGFLDDDERLLDIFAGSAVLGKVDDYIKYLDCEFVIAIGNPIIREKIAEKLIGVTWYIAIHPTAVIADIDVSIGEGTVIMANAVINSGTQIGKHCIINTGAIVEHDNQIDDFVHVSVGAQVAGTVHIGKGTWVGIGSSVKNNIVICEGCMIGAGTVIVKNIEEKGTYVGVPARRLDDIKKEKRENIRNL